MRRHDGAARCGAVRYSAVRCDAMPACAGMTRPRGEVCHRAESPTPYSIPGRGPPCTTIAPFVRSHIGVGHDITIRELAELVQHTVGHRGEIALDTSKPDGTPRKLMDASRLARAGWSARTPLAEGLRLAYAEFEGQQA